MKDEVMQESVPETPPPKYITADEALELIQKRAAEHGRRAAQSWIEKEKFKLRKRLEESAKFVEDEELFGAIPEEERGTLREKARLKGLLDYYSRQEEETAPPEEAEAPAATWFTPEELLDLLEEVEERGLDRDSKVVREDLNPYNFPTRRAWRQAVKRAAAAVVNAPKETETKKPPVVDVGPKKGAPAPDLESLRKAFERAVARRDIAEINRLRDEIDRLA